MASEPPAKLNVFIERNRRVYDVDFASGNTTFRDAITPFFGDLDYVALRELQGYTVKKSVHHFQEEGLYQLGSNDYQRIDLSDKVSTVFSIPFTDEHKNDIHLVVRGGGPLKMKVFFKNSKVVRTVQVPLETEVKDLHKYLEKKVPINAVYKLTEPVPILIKRKALDISSSVCDELDELTTLRREFPTIFSPAHIQLVIDEIMLPDEQKDQTQMMDVDRKGSKFRSFILEAMTKGNEGDEEGQPAQKRVKLEHLQLVDISEDLLRRWAKPVSMPDISLLLRYLQQPLADDEKIPISRSRFQSILSPPSIETPWLQLSSVEAGALFRVSDTVKAEELADVVIVQIIRRTPPDTGTEDSFHMYWDENIRSPLQLVLPNAEFIRNSNHHTNTHLKRPDLGCLLKNQCLFRGEEKGPDSTDDPRKELVDKLIYAYDPLRYTLGYHAVGNKVSFVAITPSTTEALYEHNFKFRRERVANFVHLIRLCGVLQWMDNTLTRRSHPEYREFVRPDGLTHITIGAVVKKEFFHPDAASRVAHLRHIYSLLATKHVPNVDALEEISAEGPFYVMLKPVGLESFPKTGEEALDAVTSILQALQHLHSEPFPLVHRDVRQPNILKRLGRKGWFLIDWSEASTLPTLASDLSLANHSPRVRQDNHGCEVDIWGVGYYLKEIASRNRLLNSYEVTQLAKRWMEDESVTATDALTDLQSAQHWF